MTVYVFVGPTLRVEEAARELDAVYCPPAAVGDVYRVACRRPAAIGIIDGLFERAPAVWHKEILWAMSEGVHVFGAASMGALRAAELADFGMVGVGRVFSAFRGGELQDDDEVAVAHAAAEHHYRALSEPLVNIRHTFSAAIAQNILSEETADRLRRIAKRLFYPDRDYERIFREAAAEHLPTRELEALRAWLPTGRVDAKREDAIAMLRLIRDSLASEPQPKRVAYRFEHTYAWEALQHQLRADVDGRRSLDDAQEAVFDELRLRGTFVAARKGALSRVLALAEARESGKQISRESVHEAAELLRREQGLLTVERFQEWLTENGVTVGELDGFLQDETRFRWVETVLADASTLCLADHLRAQGEYGELRRRAVEKQSVLDKRGIDIATELGTRGRDEKALWRWYFEDWLGQDRMPTDLSEYAVRTGFRDHVALREAVLREYLSH